MLHFICITSVYDVIQPTLPNENKTTFIFAVHSKLGQATPLGILMGLHTHILVFAVLNSVNII